MKHATAPMRTDRDGYFDALYAASEDPYGVRSRWYEERKQALLLASLPARRYARAYEPGCGIGELTAALAARCGEVLASDGSARAVRHAVDRTRSLHNVRVEERRLPADWPLTAGRFDLIVLSEIGYFLDAHELRELAACCRQTLAEGGTLVACDWRIDFAERRSSTGTVHTVLDELGLPRLVRHEESDFLLELWSEGGSVAQREGIR